LSKALDSFYYGRTTQPGQVIIRIKYLHFKNISPLEMAAEKKKKKTQFKIKSWQSLVLASLSRFNRKRKRKKEKN
jgi:hypothetical protein